MTLAEARELLKTDPRQIDALVAEKVMGWKYEHGFSWPWSKDGGYTGCELSPFTTSWDAMREVIERMRCVGYPVTIRNDLIDDWASANFGPTESEDQAICADSVPEAVALAALLAVGAITP